jgi:hypothetical protein
LSRRGHAVWHLIGLCLTGAAAPKSLFIDTRIQAMNDNRFAASGVECSGTETSRRSRTESSLRRLTIAAAAQFSLLVLTFAILFCGTVGRTAKAGLEEDTDISSTDGTDEQSDDVAATDELDPPIGQDGSMNSGGNNVIGPPICPLPLPQSGEMDLLLGASNSPNGGAGDNNVPQDQLPQLPQPGEMDQRPGGSGSRNNGAGDDNIPPSGCRRVRSRCATTMCRVTRCPATPQRRRRWRHSTIPLEIFPFAEAMWSGAMPRRANDSPQATKYTRGRRVEQSCASPTGRMSTSAS